MASTEVMRFLYTEHWWRIAAKQSLDSDSDLSEMQRPLFSMSVVQNVCFECKLYVQRIDRPLLDLVPKECLGTNVKSRMHFDVLNLLSFCCLAFGVEVLSTCPTIRRSICLQATFAWSGQQSWDLGVRKCCPRVPLAAEATTSLDALTVHCFSTKCVVSLIHQARSGGLHDRKKYQNQGANDDVDMRLMLMMMSLLIQWKGRRWYSFSYWWRCWWWGWWWKFRFGPFSILSTAGAAQMPGNNNMQRLNYAAYITLYNLHRGSTVYRESV